MKALVQSRSSRWPRAVAGILLLLTMVGASASQSADAQAYPRREAPRLVIGIMVDQMRPDYVSRYWDKLAEGGFKRLVNEGFTFSAAHFDYMPTATGPGHASVYSGTTPSVHGAMGNDWYVRALDRSINVIEVPGFQGVGSAPGYDGNKSPGNLLTTTFGDELRLHTNMRSRVVGISRKDRGAILPAGHTGDAYWFEDGTGRFVTSTYYLDRLPQWLVAFNDRNLVAEYLSKPWETLLPIEEYTESIADRSPYGRQFSDALPSGFPHDLPELVASHGHGPSLISATPFGDELLLELAFAAIEGEGLGSGPATDMLAVSFSAPDGIGHRFGPASIEVQDGFLRLDRLLARLLDRIDEQFGRDNVLLFLTSDHGVVHVPDYLTDQGIPGGHFNSSEHVRALRAHLEQKYGADFLLAFSNLEIFLDHDFIDGNDLDHGDVQREVARFMLSREGVAGALTADALNSTQFTEGIRARVQNGFHQKRSGDVLVWLGPQITAGTDRRGTTHGSPWTYDTHAPLHWYGFNIPAGRSAHPASISDIASTVATFLNSPFPSGNTGTPLNDHMR